VSHGIQDRIGRRNSLALMNLAWSQHFMWDGSKSHLDFQALAPISDSTEMDHDMIKIVKKLEQSSRYVDLFYKAFQDRNITGEYILKSLSQFQLTLISANSKYDKVILEQDTFTEQERKGYNLFKKFCEHCHTEPLFTNNKFERNGLPMDSKLRDVGRMQVTQDPYDSLRFKVPTLRNIEFSYPYMHDGRFKKLRHVIDFYSNNSLVEPKIVLSSNDKVDLISFLLTLTDKDFLFNEDFSFPKK
jgi:cytochrome c peroxidase